ncbi:cupin domain-containing protein [uncultured Hoeflea sp.]|uniref:cupin domain-containing protein n=1 Tax=uncultured Hoeflea sp. TaxID=538666 RepID=UPI0030EB718C|tara:strand:+ start:180904 stop:181482 length:579 start_codon:yes stop_codon:yes gene_type:complete
MTFPDIQRVVTGHDKNGKAIVVSDGPLPVVKELAHVPGTVFHEVWSTSATPPVIDNGDDSTFGELTISPPENGTRIRFVDIPPETEDFLKHGAASMTAAFSEVGEGKASTSSENSPHPLMHRTETIDYGIVIAGELTLVLDDSEVELKPGSVVIQRGTNHAWANRSGKPCRMLFVLIDATYDPELAKVLADR